MCKRRKKTNTNPVASCIILVMTFTAINFSFNTYANSTNDVLAFSTFDQFNSQDIETAILAVTRGQSEAVRMVGNMIVKDHIPLLEEIREMANNKEIDTLEHYGNEELLKHKAIMKTLLDKNPEEFDQFYLDYELKFSQNFVNTLKEKLIPNTEDKKLKGFLSKNLEKFKEHLTHISHAVMMLNSQNGKAIKGDHSHTQ